MFHVGFLPVVLISVGIGFQLYSKALIDPPMGPLIAGYLKSCTYSQENQFHDFICVIEPFFQDLVSNDVGKSFLAAFGTAGAVMSTSLFIKGGEPGGSILFSPLLTIAHTLAGQIFGAGIIGPIFLPALVAISRTQAPKYAHSSPPSYAYTVTLLVMQFLVFVLSILLSAIPPINPSWRFVNYLFQGFPLLFLPLALFPHTAASARKSTPTPTLTVSAFAFLKYLYAPLWWITLAQGLNAYFRQGQAFSLPCYFMALDFTGFVLAFVGMYAVEAVEGVEMVMTVPRLVGGLLLTGPASTMAAYFEGKQRLVVERAEAERTAKQ
ncbi:hypothetical protein C8R45DRAFT_1027745 [Mycena sanguinolenta]|nr:hypothetical protein C8R45DRAFT_1027745 [Mycena sanguinolenta]